MKHHPPSNEKTRDFVTTNRLHHNSSDLEDSELSIENHFNDIMMTNDSHDSTGTKLLMPHEMGGASTGATSLVGQHSIHSFNDQLQHGSSFYHSGSSFNGFHNSFHTYSSLNSNGTMVTNSQTTFPNQTHQPMNNNHNAVTTASSVPQLIHQQTFHSEKLYAAEPAVSEQAKQEVEVVEEVENVPEEAPAEENEPEIDIVISNVVCAFSVRYKLNLKEIALNGANVEFKKENGMVTMKLRKPQTTASIWSSGKITCTGATSEEHAKIAARRYARVLQKLNFRVRFQNYRVVNVLGICRMPFAIKIVQFSEKYKKEASYEPELHPGVTYNLQNPTATLKIFSTGSMTVTARSVANVQAAIEHIYPLVFEFQKPRAPKEALKEDTAEEFEMKLIGQDSDDDNFESDLDEDPLDFEPKKKRKASDGGVRDISHLTKRFKGGRKAKRPPGKTNDFEEDLIYVSDGDIDADDF